MNAPFPDKKKKLAITELEDFRLDPELTDGKPDKTDFIFFDTPTVKNEDIYKDPIMKDYSCKLSNQFLVCRF
jgi:hypothetical protein